MPHHSVNNFEELMISLEMSLDRKAFLKSIGSEIDCGYFVVVEDGNCYFFNENGNLDDISRIKTIDESYIRKDIKKIIIPDGVESIGYYAFYNCESLTSIEIPDSIESIGNYVFTLCKSMKSIEIPNGVESIGDRAFALCKSLTSIEIPDSIESIGDWAFAWCKSLTSIIFHGKTIDQVRSMKNYPWDIEDESYIKCS